MRKLLFALLASLIHTHALAAPPTQASVERILAVTKAESLLEGIYPQLEQMVRDGIKKGLAGKVLNARQQQLMDEIPGKFIATFKEEMNWQRMKPTYIQIYMESFDQQEIDGLVAFYESPAGQAYTNKMPVVMQKTMQAMQTHMATLMPKIKVVMDKAVADIKASE